MKRKLVFVFVVLILLLTACGQKGVNNPVTLRDHENNEVTFPQEEPVLFFFITTYT